MTRFLAAGAALLLSTLPVLADSAPLSLAPVPFELRLPEAIAERLSTEAMTGPWAEDTAKAGATASVLVLYEPADGRKTILMGVYYFPEAKFDAAQNPNEPPPFGREVLRQGGSVLSIAGPQDTIFEPETPDAKNVISASQLIYTPENYVPAK